MTLTQLPVDIKPVMQVSTRESCCTLATMCGLYSVVETPVSTSPLKIESPNFVQELCLEIIESE